MARITDGTKPINYSGYYQIVSPFHLGESAFRKSYVTHWRKTHPNASIEQKQLLAKVMRHLWSTADVYYDRDVDDDEAEKHIIDQTDRLRDKSKKLEEKREARCAAPPLVLEPRRKPGPVAKYGNINEYMKAYRKLNRDRLCENAKKAYDQNNTKHKALVYARKLNLPDGHKDKISKANPKFVELYKLEKTPEGKWRTNL